MNKDLIFGSLSRPSKKGGGKFFFLKNEVNLVYLGIDYKLAFYFLASMYSFFLKKKFLNFLKYKYI